MTEAALAAAEFREVSEGRLTDNGGHTYPLAPFLEDDALRRYVRYKRLYPRIRELDREHGGDIPRKFEQTAYCKRLVRTHGSIEAARAVKHGYLEELSYFTGLTNKEVALSEARTLVRLLSEMRRDGFMGLFVGDTDNGKTNTALWFALLFLLDQLALEVDVALATNIDTLEWANPQLQERTEFIETKSELEAVCERHEKVVTVLDELEIEANATVNNYEVNAEFGNVLTFKSKYGLVLFPIFHRTDGLGAAPLFREHASYFLRQQREENDLEADHYHVRFFEDHDPDDGFSNEIYDLPVPTIQPDGDYDPDEPASFDISS
ncbi:hypothetical protein AB7C87_24090 [Natrarchaeobius sp. A-rgal3]|uniref:hypothetical protein n=1 Tax=Natrarchaeobius versutus TaxID=1679078 RepID=UPI003510AAC0